jgi:hypothetical protein
MRTIAKSKKNDQAEYWKSQIKNWRASELSQKQFYRRESLAFSTFCYWKRKIERGTNPAVEFYPLTLASRAAIPESTGLLLLVCQKRFAVEIKENFSPTALTQLVSALEHL